MRWQVEQQMGAEMREVTARMQAEEKEKVCLAPAISKTYETLDPRLEA